MLKIGVLISGGGTNLQSIIDNIDNGNLNAKIETIIADRECSGLNRAKDIPTYIVSKPNMGDKLDKILKEKKVDLVVLAGFLSILDKNFVMKWKNKIINIHPSLLPKFGGKGMHGINVHKAVLENGETESGCTVHFVDDGIDSGNIISQRKVKVMPNDTPEELQKRVLREEHILLSEVINKISTKKRALISVYDKKNIVDFAKFLVEHNYEIISTGGTYKHLKNNNIPVKEVAEITQAKEMLDGRVKTLHPVIHGGILARRCDKIHMDTLKERDITPIDMVVVNLYPFFEKVKEDITFEDKIEFIDIGGPTMLRSAAKSFEDVVVISDINDYEIVKQEIEAGKIEYNTRKRLAGKIFNLTSAYDASISQFLLGDEMPKYLNLSYEKKMDLRYGENPHQKASYYIDTVNSGAMKDFKQIHGKELSFNNIRDMDIAWKVVSEFDEICCCGLKHSTPCGVALAKNSYEAYINAYNCDSVSIFGGIVALNNEIDEKTAIEMSKIFLEIIIAPSFTKEALEILEKKKNIRLIECAVRPKDKITIIKVDGGILIQDEDRCEETEFKVMTKEIPSKSQLSDMEFGMKVVKYVKSNGIVIVKNGKTLGFGNGETNRIWATEQAIERAGSEVVGSVLASDAFFPFNDVVKACAKAKITGIVQPGGSIRDEDSIKECDKNNITMVFTGIRHFKH